VRETSAHVGIFLLEAETRIDGRDDVPSFPKLGESIGEDGGDG